MNIRRIRQSLWTLAAAASIAALSLIAWGLLVSGDPLPVETGKSIVTTTSRPAELLPPLASFQVLKTVDLQRPLVDSGPPAPNRSIRLVGTILDAGHSAAVLVGPDGRSEMKEVGEIFHGAKVIAVEAEAVTILSNGQNVVLQLEKGR